MSLRKARRPCSHALAVAKQAEATNEDRRRFWSGVEDLTARLLVNLDALVSHNTDLASALYNLRAAQKAVTR